MRSLAQAGACGVLAMAAACGGDARAAGPSVRDSAGVRIVESAAPAWAEGEAWVVEAGPALDIGVAEGGPAYQFHRVAGAVRLSDGRIVVADDGALGLRWFDPSGRHLATAGRRGGGPGEFRSIDWIGALPGDSVAVWDQPGGLLAVFGPDGRLARTVRPAPLGAAAEAVGVMTDGTVVMTPGMQGGRHLPPSGFHRQAVPWLALSPDASRARTLGRYPGVEMYGAVVGGIWNGAAPSFARRVHFAAAPGGYYAADDVRYDLAFHDVRGALRRRVRRAHTPVRVTAEDLESSAGKQIVGMPPGMAQSFRRLEEGMRRDLPRDQTFPAHGRLLADPAGWLWVAEHTPPLEPPSRWSVFDPRGRWMGTVETPAGLDVLQVGPGWVLGTAADDMDVPHVRLHRIRKPGEGDRNRP